MNNTDNSLNEIRESIKDINRLCELVHNDNVDRGFYDTKRETGTLLMLIVSELAEALEADRKNRKAQPAEYRKAVTSDTMEEREAFETYIKNSFEDEIADTFIRLFDLCGYMKIDILTHIVEKLEYNRGRGYKHGKLY